MLFNRQASVTGTHIDTLPMKRKSKCDTSLLSILQGADRSIWLCDDIFAAVDVHTAALLLHTLQGPLLASKTRIVATRHQPCIAAADMVVTLEGGAMSRIGAAPLVPRHQASTCYIESSTVSLPI